MKRPEKKMKIDVLVEGQAGELLLARARESRPGLLRLVEASKNPVIKHNVFRQGSRKKVKLA